MGIGDCCGTATRCILVVINVPIFLAGLIFLIAGGVFKAKSFDFFPELEDYSANVDSVLIPLLVIGAIFLVIGLLGCVGACTEKGWLLKPYFALVLIIILAQIAIIIAGVVKKDAVIKYAEDTTTKLFDEYKEQYVNGNTTVDMDAKDALAVNSGQSFVGCCGLTNGSSWWKTATSMKYPPGCCTTFNNFDIKDIDENNALTDTCLDDGTLYEDGCTEKMSAILDEFGVVIGGVIAAIIVFQVLCLAAACFVWKRGDSDNATA